ncbi:MAG: DnaA/Hda family protein [Planctomycetia bacterium]|nr:DnaA/Hda family protein [Planctomycetia bacterium]
MSSIIKLPLFEKTSASARPNEKGRAKADFRPNPFVVGEENYVLCSAAYEVLGNFPKSFSMVFHAPFGFGKTHLVEGLFVAWLAQNPDCEGKFASAADFAKAWAAAQRSQTTKEFLDKYKNIDMFVLEDLHEIVKNTAAQEQLVTMMDQFAQRGVKLIFSSAQSPTLLPLLPKLTSRLKEGICIPILEPSVDARQEILLLEKHASRVAFSPDATSALAELSAKTQMTIFDMLNAQKQLDFQRKTAAQDIVTFASVKKFFTEKSQRSNVSIADIAKIVAKYYKVRLADIRSRSRRATLVTTRGIVYYLARRLTNATLQEIGEYFGGRDHTTILHGCTQIEMLVKNDESVRQSLEHLTSELRPISNPPAPDDRPASRKGKKGGETD